MSKIIDYLQAREDEGFTIRVDPKEDNVNGLTVDIIGAQGIVVFVTIIGPKTLGEWIRLHGTAA